MFRLVVLSAFVAVAVAAPGHLHGADVLSYAAPSYHHQYSEPIITGYEKTVIKPEYTVVEQPTVQHVGNIVKSYPSAVSHQSSSVVHSHGHVVEPILAHGVSKTIVSTPIVEKHITPVIQKHIIAEPAIHHHHAAPLAYHASPIAYHAASPLSYSNDWHAPSHLSYSSW